MIVWITGNSGAGKTTLSQQMKTKKTILLDGDELREIYPTGFSEKDRHEHNLRVAQLAVLLENQGFDVIVSLIAPYKKTRKAIEEITGCAFIDLAVDPKSEEYPYEYDDKRFYFKKNTDKKG